jgi:hypothetical protein
MIFRNIVLLVAVFFAQISYAGFSFDVETGVLSTTYNNIRIPGDSGTKFSLCDDLEDDPVFFYRLRLNYLLKEKHFFSLLYAPLTIESTGRFDKDVIYRDAFFPSGTDMEASYTFNSYRLTYRYEWINSDKYEFGIGFTGKIRDAGIELKSANDSAGKKNVGFVPIINFRFFYKPLDNFGILLEGDALAAPQGRAEDVLAAAVYKYNENLSIKAGYRLLEGGADNDEVYTFSLINYAVLGITFNF